MKRLINKCNLIIFITLILLINLIFPSYAVDSQLQSTIEVSYITENNTLPMNNVDVFIYKLASFDNETYKTTWKEIFSDFEVDFEETSDEEIISDAAKLSDYIKSNNISYDYKLTTDSSGKDNITFDNGIYLICGQEKTLDNIIYTPIPCILELPYTSSTGSLVHDVSIELKYNRTEKDIPQSPESKPSKNTHSLNTGDTIIITFIVLVISIILNIIVYVKKKKEEK